ncbi:MAG: hypothetical protein Q8S58_18455 [Bosea sp. (in: a-proteobacteria)]|uniref:M12 family metallo-peptidase n=1 Tax=Bosea sp. (in: a-proteobacteria) TaxID=1871050 RepID=UPI0027330C0E|nr:M12 family metallo-peptidase [Bosea sp. (in: a-proteobacteria)]MDP3258482.1 hypothetical protein [Bosea sp. (in: a-proteobacteria)]MDP3321109.1 hypothetical protein [Bosea sp. (in: a-proteobacteria)]
MPHFVKFVGNPHQAAPPAVKRVTQSIAVGTSIRVGFKDTQSWIDVRASNARVRITKREAVESSNNGIAWYEIVGMDEGATEITAVDTNTNYVWDRFKIEVKGKAKSVNRPPIRGMTFNYYVDTKGIGPNYNASVVIDWKVALIPVAAGPVSDFSGTSFPAQKWGSDWNGWTAKFKKKIESAWSEKFWLSTPASLHQLEVGDGAGGKRRVNLHCVLKCILSPPGAAHQIIRVAKTGLATGGTFRSESRLLDDADLKDDPVGTYVNQTKPFNTAIHEIGHNLGFTHACEATTPATPYCVATDPNGAEIMATGNELRLRYATPWQRAAAVWFTTAGTPCTPSDFSPSLTRLAPVPVP